MWVICWRHKSQSASRISEITFAHHCIRPKVTQRRQRGRRKEKEARETQRRAREEERDACQVVLGYGGPQEAVMSSSSILFVS
jgi:hypothetical protein